MAKIALMLVLVLAGCGGSGPATNFTATLAGGNEVPATTSSGTGSATLTLSGTTVNYTVTFTGLSAAASMSHIHVGPATGTGPVVVPFTGIPSATSGSFSGSFTAANVLTASIPDGGMGVDAGDFNGLLQLMRAGDTYTNVHTTTYTGGEIRGQNQPQ